MTMKPDPDTKTSEELLIEFEDDEDTITKHISEITKAATKLSQAASQVEE